MCSTHDHCVNKDTSTTLKGKKINIYKKKNMMNVINIFALSYAKIKYHYGFWHGV